MNDVSDELKHYWAGRQVASASSFGSLLKRSALTRGLTELLFSVRVADEAFLARALQRRKVRSMLDIACGSGKAVVPSLVDFVAGVDITGYPKEQALAKGYNLCLDYDPPDYHIALDRQVEAVTAINLNAHIPAEAYARILTRGLEFLKPGGALILIHEYDNEGLSYRWMHRHQRKFERFVHGMEHWHLRSEGETLKSLAPTVDGMRLITRHPLTAALLPSIHYYAYARQRDPGALLRRLFVLTDVPVSIANYVQCRLSQSFDRSFLVGYLYEKPA